MSTLISVSYSTGIVNWKFQLITADLLHRITKFSFYIGFLLNKKIHQNCSHEFQCINWALIFTNFPNYMLTSTIDIVRIKCSMKEI